MIGLNVNQHGYIGSTIIKLPLLYTVYRILTLFILISHKHFPSCWVCSVTTGRRFGIHLLEACMDIIIVYTQFIIHAILTSN